MEKYTLQEARELRGMSRPELSVASDISLSVIKRIEGDNPTGYAINVNSATALARALGMKVEEIRWPNGLSTLGRPPHTSGIPARRTTFTQTTTFTVEETVVQICPNCYTEIANNGECLCNA